MPMFRDRMSRPGLIGGGRDRRDDRGDRRDDRQDDRGDRRDDRGDRRRPAGPSASWAWTVQVTGNPDQWPAAGDDGDRPVAESSPPLPM